MQVAMLYRPNTEHEREITEYVREFQHRYPESKIDLISLDTQAGDDLARVYDIIDYPALLARADDGHLLKDWQGMPLPLMNEVAFYLTTV